MVRLCKTDFKNEIKSSKMEQFCKKKKVHLQPYSSQWNGKGLIARYINCRAVAMVICAGPPPFRGTDRSLILRPHDSGLPDKRFRGPLL